ncbi:hypothetical protein DFH08DRAFT_798929 [Mycena albidolilacea]|uniref:Uncharacterized protein n=1 Tax=Mycena albidolilacea TaxID=1033008 RepID=A0AAD7AQN8_9AGAR|nr:hypothetical protein DFH08DRAFT_798929 [Mycena albidolilacea]
MFDPVKPTLISPTLLVHGSKMIAPNPINGVCFKSNIKFLAIKLQLRKNSINTLRRYFAGKSSARGLPKTFLEALTRLLFGALFELNMGVLLTPIGTFFLWLIAVGYRPILDNEHTAATILTLLAELFLCFASTRWGVVETPGFEPVFSMLTVFLVAENSPFLRDMYAVAYLLITAWLWNCLLRKTGMEGRTWRCTIVLGERPEILGGAAKAFMSGSGPDIRPGNDVDLNLK